MILKLIEQKRKEMLNNANLFGITSNKTLQISQELDTLLNIYNSTRKNKQRPLDRKSLTHKSTLQNILEGNSIFEY